MARMNKRTDEYRTTIGGIEYKIGLHGMVFMKINDVWIRSSKEPHEIIVRKARKLIGGQDEANEQT